MKKLMMVAMTVVGLAVFAQEQEAAPKAGPHRGPGRGSRMAERGGMPRGGRGMHGGMFGPGMVGDPAVMAVMNPQVADKIGVTKEVQEQIRKIDADSRKVVRDMQQKTQGAMEKQASLMKEAKPDEAAVMAAIDELFDLRKEMAKAQTKRVLAVKALLTPEQLASALETMKKLRDERRARAGAPKGDAAAKDEGEKKAPPPPPPAK